MLAAIQKKQELTEEQKAHYNKYGMLPKAGAAGVAQMRMNKQGAGKKYFDSAEFELGKKGPNGLVLPGTTPATNPSQLPHKTTAKTKNSPRGEQPSWTEENQEDSQESNSPQTE